MRPPAHLLDKSPGQLADELRGFPDGALEAVLAFRDGGGAAAFDLAMRRMLAHYQPAKLRRSLDDVDDNIRLREDLGIDSLAVTEAVFKMEDVFGFTVDTREMNNVRTLGEARALLEGKLADG